MFRNKPHGRRKGGMLRRFLCMLTVIGIAAGFFAFDSTNTYAAAPEETITDEEAAMVGPEIAVHFMYAKTGDQVTLQMWAERRGETLFVSDVVDVAPGETIVPLSYGIYFRFTVYLTATGIITVNSNTTPILYTVQYLPGEHGAFAPLAYTSMYRNEPTPAAPAPVGEPGWEFAGWSHIIPATVYTDATYTALWAPVAAATYVVAYDPNGGYGAPRDNNMYAPGDTVWIPAQKPERSGYKFAGWLNNTDSRIYQPGEAFSMPDSDFIMAAQWEVLTPITITAASATKLYDGTALTDSGYTYSSLPDGVTNVMAETIGSQTGAGQSVNEIARYQIFSADGNDVTAGFPVDLVSGTLTVTPREVVLSSASETRPYNGQPLQSHNVLVSGDGFVPGESVVFSVTGSITDPGSVENTFVYAPNPGTNLNNYSIAVVYGTLTVTEAIPVPEESLSYTVRYFQEGTNVRVRADKRVSGLGVGSSVTESAASVTGYTALAPQSQKITLAASGYEFTFYYTRSNNGSDGRNDGYGVTLPPAAPNTPPAVTITDEPTPAGVLPVTGGAPAIGLRTGGLLSILAAILGLLRKRPGK